MRAPPQHPVLPPVACNPVDPEVLGLGRSQIASRRYSGRMPAGVAAHGLPRRVTSRRTACSNRAIPAPAQLLDPHATVLAECPAGIVRDLPYVAVGIGEGAGCSAPLRAGGWAQHGAACSFGLGQ